MRVHMYAVFLQFKMFSVHEQRQLLVELCFSKEEICFTPLG